MKVYRAVGTILLESTLDEAGYDIDMEWHGDKPPNEMDVLRWLLDSGDIQIISESITLEEDE